MPSVKERILSTLRGETRRYQIAGVRFMEERRGRLILGDDCGIGKTYQAIAWQAINPDAAPTVIVCPASIKLKWQRELELFAGIKADVLWGFKPYVAHINLWREIRGVGQPKETIRRFNSQAKQDEFLSENWHRLDVLEKVIDEVPPLERVVIINYDLLEDWLEFLVTAKPNTIIVDECQRCKNSRSKRSRMTKALASVCKYTIFLSGTLMMNRPVELFTVLNILDPQRFNSFWKFAFRFCAPKRGFRGSWDFSGDSNLEELNGILNEYMIRRMKVDVLPELPAKIRTIIPIEIDNRREYERAKASFVQWLTERRGRDAAERARGAISLVKLGALKRLAAEGKLATVKDWVDDWLEDTDKKLVLFAVHKVVVDFFMLHYPTAAKIDGRVPPRRRQEAIDRFQNDPACRLFVGNIDAAGTGTDLFASSSVAFVELGWVPGEHDQAEDRCLRIGQKADSVDAFYFIGKDTIDEKILEIIEEKRKVVGQVLDGRDVSADVQRRVIDTLIGR